MDWLKKSTIFICKHGSQAYGLATDQSDLDLKGICIPPAEIDQHLFNKFDQCENNPEIEKEFNHLRNPNNPKIESCIYSIKKFFVLAAAVNPNIIELLWIDDKDVLYSHPIFDRLKKNRDIFLSTRAKFTFSGYAAAQLELIYRHRKWLVKGILEKPNRENYGLAPQPPARVNEFFGFVKSEVEKWSFNEFPIEQKIDLKERTWDVLYRLGEYKIDWATWPEEYNKAAILKLSEKVNLSKDVIAVLLKEKEYKKDLDSYEAWLSWKKNRNPLRAKLEEKAGYDTKNASHLVRLLRMGSEILSGKEIIVKRPDAEELLNIKNGGWSYEYLIDYSNGMQKKLDELYNSSSLPKVVNYEKINAFYHDLMKFGELA